MLDWVNRADDRENQWQRERKRKGEIDDEYQEIVGEILDDMTLISNNDNGNLKIPINN